MAIFLLSSIWNTPIGSSVVFHDPSIFRAPFSANLTGREFGNNNATALLQLFASNYYDDQRPGYVWHSEH